MSAPAVIARELAHQERRRAASRLPAIPLCVGQIEPIAAPPSWPFDLHACLTPLRVPLAETARVTV